MAMVMNHIALEQLKYRRLKLEKFAAINENDIQIIWRNDSDPLLSDSNKLKYDFDIPLYQKMIFRFINAGKRTSGLYKGCDPCNRQRLLNYCGLNCADGDLMEFFSWITYGLGEYNILALENNEYSEDIANASPLVKLWREKSDIVFFFSISEDSQLKLIEKYNRECVERYNRIMLKY